VRFSYLPPGSLRLPKKHLCQPATAVEYAQAKALRDDSSLSDEKLDEIAQAVEARVHPAFVTLIYGQAGYGMLRPETDQALLTGADNGSEIGAMNHLFNAQRLTNLYTRFKEYLRYGLEAGVIFEDE
jgi:hypothetical protein